MSPHRRLLLAVFLIYAISARGYVESLDTDFSVATAESIVSRGQLDVAEHLEGYTAVGVDGKYYSKYGFGLPLYFVPFVAAGHAGAALTGLPEPYLTGFFISFAQIPFALLVLFLFARQLRTLGASDNHILLLTVVLGLGTLCWRYACSDFSEMMQAAFLLAAYHGVVRRDTRGIVLGGAAFGALVLVKLVHIALLPVFLLYLLVPRKDTARVRLSRLALFMTPVALFGVAIACLNLVRFGNIFSSGYGHEATLFFPSQLWYSLPALLLSADKGLLIFSPALLLGVIGIPEFFRRFPREAALNVGIMTVLFLLAGAWHSWAGGWSWGPRLLVPAIPLLLLAGTFALEREPLPTRLPVLPALIGVSILAQVPGILVNDQEIHRIKETLLYQNERPQALGDFPLAAVLAWHKVTGGAERYDIAALGIKGHRRLDLDDERRFRGVDIWTEHAARQLGRPWLRYLALIGVVGVGLLLWVGLAARLALHPRPIGPIDRRPVLLRRVTRRLGS